jgi:hypothetical protein
MLPIRYLSLSFLTEIDPPMRKSFQNIPKKASSFSKKKNNNNNWGVAHGFGHPMDHLGVTGHAPPFGLGGGHLEVATFGRPEPSLWSMGWPKQSPTIFFFFKKKMNF